MALQEDSMEAQRNTAAGMHPSPPGSQPAAEPPLLPPACGTGLNGLAPATGSGAVEPLPNGIAAPAQPVPAHVAVKSPVVEPATSPAKSFSRRATTSTAESDDSSSECDSPNRTLSARPAQDAETSQQYRAQGGPNNRYLCYEKIGSGSYKNVYKAMDSDDCVEVAWLELKQHKIVDREHFKSETALLKRLKHKNIIRFYDYWELDNTAVMITELMEGGTLKGYLKHKPKLKIINGWCKQILKGLHYLHTRNPVVVHRDIKCENIFMHGATNEIKIGDMGLACVLRDDYAHDVLGTAQFMAPEMLCERYNEKVDVYAFGMSMLEMITFKEPYSECRHVGQVVGRVCQGILPLALETVSQKRCKDFILKCLEPDFEKRPSVRDLMKDDFWNMSELDLEHSTMTVRGINDNGSMDMTLSKVALTNGHTTKINFVLDPTETPADIVQSMVSELLIPQEVQSEVTTCMARLLSAAHVNPGTLPLALPLQQSDEWMASAPSSSQPSEAATPQTGSPTSSLTGSQAAAGSLPWWGHATKEGFYDTVKAKSTAFSAVANFREDVQHAKRDELTRLLDHQAEQLAVIQNTVKQLVGMHCSELQKFAADLASFAEVPIPLGVMGSLRGCTSQNLPVDAQSNISTQVSDLGTALSQAHSLPTQPPRAPSPGPGACSAVSEASTATTNLTV